MVGHGKRFAVIEASSHGLSKKNNRLGNIDFDCAVLTNISHEHLEFHGSYEQYRRDKANLFRFLDQHRSKTNTAFGVVNLDDPNVAFFRNVTNSPVYTFSTKDPSADIYADMVSMIGPKNDGPTDSGPKWANIDSMGRGPKHVSVNPEEQSSKFANGDSTDQGSKPATRQSYTQESGTHLELRFAGRRHRTVLPIPGVYNIDNMLAAVLSVHYATGISMERICNSIPGLKPIPGRMTNISAGQPFSVTVDFAHTPGAFSRLLPAAKRQTEGKLIVLFGSAGDRDKAKRRMQGSVADEHADIIVLTDEDPRSEDPIAIMEEIASACSSHIRGSSLFLIPDRKEAIRKALSVAGPGDSVLLLGKGHENSIIYASESRPWDEVAAAQEALERMGYGSHVTS
jgi:UDP-N-acetylmuramoyl-L-alanyl-D-glutamate--2,6-diaminopimelate ligase